jgi:hypothetical protein
MEDREETRILFARFLYSWIIILVSFFILWITSMIDTKLYTVLNVLATAIIIIWLLKLMRM